MVTAPPPSDQRRSDGRTGDRPDLVVGLGELLWDEYDDEKRLGGAPANFAYHAAVLGDDGVVASRVGDDALGREALEKLRETRVSTAYVQVDANAPTGCTRVTRDAAGEPSFTIPGEVAWDRLEWTPAWHDLAERADVVCFGSLALRSSQSRNTILEFLRATRPNTLRVFDVNLRHSFYTTALIAELMGLAGIVKVNERELGDLSEVLELGDGTPARQAHRLLVAHKLDLVCVTRGRHGSVLTTEAETVEHDGRKVKVVDTTGAGDAFTAALAHYYRRGAPLGAIGTRANRLAAWVTTKVGATPPVEPGVLNDLRAAVPGSA